MDQNIVSQIMGLSNEASLESIQKIDSTVKGMLAVAKKDTKAEKKELQVHVTTNKRKIQDEKRDRPDLKKKKDRGIVTKQYKTEGQKKKGINWMLAGAGLLTVGGVVAWKNKEKIQAQFNTFVENDVKPVVSKALTEAFETIPKYINEKSTEIGKAVWDGIAKMFGFGGDDEETDQPTMTIGGVDNVTSNDMDRALTQSISENPDDLLEEATSTNKEVKNLNTQIADETKLIDDKSSHTKGKGSGSYRRRAELQQQLAEKKARLSELVAGNKSLQDKLKAQVESKETEKVVTPEEKQTGGEILQSSANFFINQAPQQSPMIKLQTGGEVQLGDTKYEDTSGSPIEFRTEAVPFFNQLGDAASKEGIELSSIVMPQKKEETFSPMMNLFRQTEDSEPVGDTFNVNMNFSGPKWLKENSSKFNFDYEEGSTRFNYTGPGSEKKDTSIKPKEKKKGLVQQGVGSFLDWLPINRGTEDEPAGPIGMGANILYIITSAFGNVMEDIFKEGIPDEVAEVAPPQKQPSQLISGTIPDFDMHDKFLNTIAEKTGSQVIVVPRGRPIVAPSPATRKIESPSRGSGINMMEVAQYIHRLNGAKV